MGPRKVLQRNIALLLGILAHSLMTDGVCAQVKQKVEIVSQLGHRGALISVAFSPDGARVLSGSADRTLKLWDVATGALIRTFDGHLSSVL
jgi:WD40 repeat protein